MLFKLNSKYSPAGSQPDAIKKLVEGIRNKEKDQVLLGVTGSGKTFTMANIIKDLEMPALVMAPNKILSAQLYEEFKEFFPDNAVEYFVSYYDYYRPEAYIPQKGLYIEKEASVNDTIDQLRHKATRSLMERKDVIIIASVSCIYGIGSHEAYRDLIFNLGVGEKVSVPAILRQCTSLGYVVADDFSRGTMKSRGNYFWIGPSHIADRAWRVAIEKNVIQEIVEIDPLTRKVFQKMEKVSIFPNSHHITPEYSLGKAIKDIEDELAAYLPALYSKGEVAAAQRLEERVRYDIAQLKANGFCQGIENYSRFFTGRKEGDHPPTLFEYFPKPFVLFVDESHVSVPQVSGMSKGDAARKNVLIEHGFRMPSARDNRPMKFEEWDNMRPETIFVSATPGEFEKENGKVVEQLVRPTGLLDPICEVRPTANQIEDALKEVDKIIAKNERVLMLTLTKKTAESLSDYLSSKGYKIAYMHGDQTTIERIQKLYDFRKGTIDIIVGINLLREGIDIPECSLVCIFEADQEGFLRTASTLIQMIGRAARNENGRVILYADRESGAMKNALAETKRRRQIQEEYNLEHGITPKTIKKEISEAFAPFLANIKDKKAIKPEWMKMKESQRAKEIKKLDKEMKKAAQEMDFEKAAELRDQKNALLSLDQFKDV